MEDHVGGLREQATEITHESARMGLDEVALQRVVIGPFLHKHIAIGLLEVRVDAVAGATVLFARAAAHLARHLNETRAVLRGNVNTTGDEDHVVNATGARR